MIHSRSFQHAVKALVAMAEGERPVFHPVRELSGRTGVPVPMLAKVLGALAAHGVVESSRGAAGGFRLADPPDRITLYQIAVATDAPEIIESCAFGAPLCSGEAECAVHPKWEEVRSRVLNFLHTTTLSEMTGARVAALLNERQT